MKPHILILATLALAISSVTAQAIDFEDVPSTCQSACSPVVAASDACEELEDDDDASEWVCVCAAQGMSTAVPECLSCVQSAGVAGGDDDDDGGDILAGLGSCGFSAAPASSSAVATSPTQIVTQTQTQTEAAGSVGTTAGAGSSAGVVDTTTNLLGSAVPTTTGGDGVASSPATTSAPTQGSSGAPPDLDGSALTVITATMGTGEDAMVATLTSVVPGPVVTSDAVEQQTGNGQARAVAPTAAAALFGFAVAFL